MLGLVLGFRGIAAALNLESWLLPILTSGRSEDIIPPVRVHDGYFMACTESLYVQVATYWRDKL